MKIILGSLLTLIISRGLINYTPEILSFKQERMLFILEKVP